MAQIIRHCPDCGWDRPFEQHHDRPGECPDSPDGDCAEWSCTACGAGLLIGVTWLAPEAATPATSRPVGASSSPAELHGRVA
jgi:hypothetical protein